MERFTYLHLKFLTLKIMHKKLSKIGILGGMGPAASAELYKKIIQYCQTQYHCVQDEDFPQIFVNSLTLLGFDEKGIVKPDLVKSQLIEGIKQLEPLVDIIVIPCNTVHVFINDLRLISNVPILSILELTAEKLQDHQNKCIGLLSSASTRQMKIYHSKLEPNGVKVLSLDGKEQLKIDTIIERVMGGNQTMHDDKILQKISENLRRKGADAIVIGCTELPFAMKQMSGLPTYDTLQILAEGIVDEIFREKMGNKS